MWLTENADVLGFESRQTASRLMKVASEWCVDAPLDEVTALRINRMVWGNEEGGGGHSVKPYNGDEEWYTPAKYVNMARRVLGDIDLDPASNEHAQRVVKAKRYFTKEDDALTQDWHGRVWLNPPYSKGLLLQFVNKMVHEVETENVTAAIMLLNNFTDADWFQNACSVCAAICFPRGRIYFKNASGKIDDRSTAVCSFTTALTLTRSPPSSLRSAAGLSVREPGSGQPNETAHCHAPISHCGRATHGSSLECPS